MPQSACQRQVYLMLGQLPDPAADKERLRRDLESLTQIIAAAGASHQNPVAATALFGNEAAVSREVDRLRVKLPVERINVAEPEYLHSTEWCVRCDPGAGMALATTTEVS